MLTSRYAVQRDPTANIFDEVEMKEIFTNVEMILFARLYLFQFLYFDRTRNDDERYITDAWRCY